MIRHLSMFTVVLFSAGSVLGEDIIVESSKDGLNSKNYRETVGVWMDSKTPPETAKSNAPGLTDRTKVGSRTYLISSEKAAGGATVLAAARFKFVVKNAGSFYVYATWPKSANAGPINYVIKHSRGTETVAMVQDGWGKSAQSNANQWNLLGQYPFSGVGEEYVEMQIPKEVTAADPNSGARANADAIRLTSELLAPDQIYTASTSSTPAPKAPSAGATASTPAPATPAASAGSSERLLSDTFDGRVNAQPDNWTISGGLKAPFFVITQVGNQKKISTGVPIGTNPTTMITKAPESASWTDYFGQIDATWEGDKGGIVVVARWKDPNNFYEGGVFTDGTTRYMKIDRIVGGVRTTLARQENSPEFSIPAIEKADGASPTVVLRLIVVGDEIVLQVAHQKDQARLGVRDSSHTAGRFGAGVLGGPAVLDNAIVKANTQDVHTVGSVPTAAGAVLSESAVQAQPTPPAQPKPRSNASAGTAASPRIDWLATLDSARAKASATDKRLLLFFVNASSDRVKRIEADIVDTPSVRTVLDARYVAVKLEMDTYGDLAKQLGVFRAGTILTYDSQGRGIDTISDFTTAADLAARLSK